ncbi:ParB/RepB/Spo0J family partition protein [Lacrimispora indolis]|uniref:ParB/RepB/Spo0J family partition protein n=1 Tax=Lacrimispora indolis TaxID=69825 RepID=UPI0004190B1E|nr:ParB/RepB/Spo0J family partition protein [[Clostridium] methoxybenzovorans]
MSSRSADKIVFTSYDDLFGENQKAEAGESVVNLPLSRLHSFKNHPFHVIDDEKMQETVKSVRQYGVLVPAIVREDEVRGDYEIIAGHRRKRACELAGHTEMPVIVRKVTDDEAVIIMVDSNIQREDILPSEKAWAYRMKMEALSHQGVKGEEYTADLVGEAAGDSARTVQRYIRLTYLKPELLDYADQGKIILAVAEKLSFLNEEEQSWVMHIISENVMIPSKSQAEELKEESRKGKLTEKRVADILNREVKKVSITISSKKIKDYFPQDYTKKQIEEVIFELLDSWKEKMNQAG